MLKAPERLVGGDNKAWLTQFGDAGDNNFCDASLRLPLSNEKVWEYRYHGSEIGPEPSGDLVHFNGLLVGSGSRSVLFGLEAQTGRELFKQDSYQRSIDERPELERFYGLMFSPAGTLAALGEDGRFYSWDWPQRSLRLRSVSESIEQHRSGFVALDGLLIGSNSQRLVALRQDALGQTLWNEQLALIPRGVVAHEDFVLVWTAHGLISCLNTDGSNRWRSDEGSRILRCTISRDGARVFVVLRQQEELVCRMADSGREIWRYSYQHLRSQDERKALVEQLSAEGFEPMGDGSGSRSIILQTQLLSDTPYGVVLGTQSGDLVLLDKANGIPLWQVRCDGILDSGICFNNGVLLHLSYSPRLDPRFSETLLPFQLSAPDWPEIAEQDRVPRFPRQGSQSVQVAGSTDATDTGSGFVRLLYGRFIVLNPADGTISSVHVEASPAGGSIVPAHDLLVVANERQDRVVPGRGRNEPCQIVAYRWLE
jgi:outer membrane protein assembly factor BamB